MIIVIIDDNIIIVILMKTDIERIGCVPWLYTQT